MRKVSLFFAILLLLGALVSCGYKYDGASLIGTWISDNADESDYVVYDFYSGDKVTMTHYNYGIPYAKADCHYEISNGDEIIITDENGYYEINKFKIKNDTLTIKGKSKTKLKRYESSYNKDEKIFGEWIDASGDGYVFGEEYEGLTYNKDNEIMYFAYSTKGNILYFEPMLNTNLILPITYRIDENMLYLDYDGENYATLERVEK